MTLLLLGLINWIATSILVESELTAPLRRWVEQRLSDSVTVLSVDIGDPETGTYGTKATAEFSTFWAKAHYFVGCHLCVGVWVGIAEALLLVHPLIGHGPGGLLLTALAIKAIGHLTLELVAVLQGLR